VKAAHAREMAAYSQWMNSRFYAVAAQPSDAERRADRGAFFKSVHGTLNHVTSASPTSSSVPGRPNAVRTDPAPASISCTGNAGHPGS
jgi:hypothetical protein